MAMGKRDGSRGMGKRGWFVGFLTGVWLSILGGCPYLLLKSPERVLPLLGEKELVFEFLRDTTKLPVQEDIAESDYTRRTITFPSQGTTIEAWLYLPQTKPAPIVIMGHGLGSQKDMGLHPFAEQFAQAGMAVLVIDYRGFGGSDGLPRHHISWRKHLEDYQAALDWVHLGQMDPQEVDASRIALWGVSYSGAHALMTAAKEGNEKKVAAVVANEPFLTGDGSIGKAIKERGLLKVARLVCAAVIDKAREFFGLDAIYVKLVGPYEELALLNMSKEELLAARGGQAPYPPQRIGG
ncbi:Alpha/Beta hydrolase protein [Dunaliella salina]|uniref:Alpha/Beta hydrolase protein n=1 Tax=Dunaliella salina TaxID=3046 RepID=A0ABQ7GVS1_DUNSA|nr:Alpha/Beta hydrolase protein [Dunaliella salina]|eukprot:KAF5838711.1 Alpha/Beta hydrolase protein [Dunaliella salina]